MRVFPILLTGFLLTALAGCLDAGTEETDAVDAEPDPPSSPGTGSSPPGGDAVADDATNATLVEVPLQYDGNLGTYFFACEVQTLSSCYGSGATSPENDLYHEQPGATLVGATLTLAWSAPTPATETLGIRLSHPGTDFRHDVQGTSPLTLDLSGLDIPLGDDGVHITVHNARGVVSQSPLYAYVSVDQDFTIEGSLTLRA